LVLEVEAASAVPPSAREFNFGARLVPSRRGFPLEPRLGYCDLAQHGVRQRQIC
jgi:hypothetical protein